MRFSKVSNQILLQRAENDFIASFLDATSDEETEDDATICQVFLPWVTALRALSFETWFFCGMKAVDNNNCIWWKLSICLNRGWKISLSRTMRSLCSFLEQPRTHAKTLQERILLQTVLLMLAVLLAGFSYLNEYSLTGICKYWRYWRCEWSSLFVVRRKMTSSRYMIHDLTWHIWKI